MASYDQTRSRWRITANTYDATGTRRRVVRHVNAPNDRGGRTKAEAAEALLRGKVDEVGAPSREAFASVAAMWVEAHRGKWSANTTRHTLAELANHITPAIGTKRVDGLDPLAIETMYTAWSAAGVAAPTMRRRHGIVHAVFAYAERLGLVHANPMRRVEPCGGKAPERDVPMAAEVGRIIAEAGTVPARVFLALAAGTGARRGSLLGLTWRHVDLDDASVWFKVTKESRPYAVTIDDSIVAELAELRRQAVETAMAIGTTATLDDHYVFSDDGGATAWWPTSASRVFRLAAEAAELGDRFTLHALRHYHATACLRAGMSTKAVATRLGCTEANVIGTYSHHVPDPELDRRAAALFAVAPLAVVEARPARVRQMARS